MKYVALLRGINVGGKNPVKMAELKNCIESLGYRNVQTYINSGNILFEMTVTKLPKLVANCEQAIEKQFGFHVVCAVITADDLLQAVDKAPDWWGKPDGDKHNAIFVIAPATAATVMQQVGAAKPEYEKVAAEGPIIFWSAPFKTFSRSQYSKIVGTPAYQSVTIRNDRTTRKLAELCQQ